MTMSQLKAKLRPHHLLGLACLLGLIGPAPAQERPRTDEIARLEQLRSGTLPLDDEAKQLLEKFAKYFAAQLTDSNIQREGMSKLVTDLNRRLLIPPQHPYERLTPEQKKFVDEFGRALITQLETVALNNSKPIVRINAARMAAQVGLSGYDGSAELFIKILENPNESDAVKNYALEGMTNLFSIEPNKQGQPGRTIFQKTDNLQQTLLERRSIQTLIAFINRKSPLPPDAPEDQLNALRFVRCEAIRALGKVRVQTLRNLGQVEGRPALILLKASRSDGLAPPTNVKERVEAIVGFCQLLPDRDRDLQLAYAIYHLGQAICELADYKNANPTDQSMPWKVAAARMQDAIELWRASADNMKLENARLVRDFLDMANVHVLEPLAAGREGNAPNVEALRNWLNAQVAPAPNASLFKSDPSTILSLR